METDAIKTLSDSDPMPYGKYRGRKMLKVPAKHLHLLWCEGMVDSDPVKGYIIRNMAALQMEHKDGIW